MIETRYGYCECGCGQKTNLAKSTNKSKGTVKGQPLRFIHNHHTRGSRNSNYRPLLERFWAQIDKRGPDECWLWTGSHHGGGYGLFSVNQRSVRAHRFAWELANDPIPKGLHVLHKCDNPSCTNPNHLFLGTHTDNMQDMQNKGRQNLPVGEAHHATSLTEEQVKQIRQRRADGETGVSLAKEYGVTPAAICAIYKRKNWRHV